MSQEVTQGVTTKLITNLVDSNDSPKTGLVYTDVTCSYLKYGASSFVGKTLTALNFTEIGLGAYYIEFTSSELDTLKTFQWIVSGASIKQAPFFANIVAVSSPSTPVSVQTCAVFGYMQSLSGDPRVGSSVFARVLSSPQLQGNFLISNDTYINTSTDLNGYFSLELLRGATVEIFIPDSNYRRQIRVPNSVSANLFTEI